MVFLDSPCRAHRQPRVVDVAARCNDCGVSPAGLLPHARLVGAATTPAQHGASSRSARRDSVGIGHSSMPPLAIYFGPLGLGAVPMTQIFNPCFPVGKSLHALTLGISGQIGLVALAFGIRIRNWLEPESYQRFYDWCCERMRCSWCCSLVGAMGLRFCPDA